MKKVLSFVIALAMLAAMSVTVFADETKAVQIDYVFENEPTYSMSIPSSLTLAKDGSDITFTASDVENLGDKTISVTIAGTDYFRNQMVLVDPETRKTMRYQIITTDGTVIETTGDKDQANGKEVASFTDNGSVTCKVMPVITPYSVPGNYTGTINFSIGLK